MESIRASTQLPQPAHESKTQLKPEAEVQDIEAGTTDGLSSGSHRAFKCMSSDKP